MTMNQRELAIICKRLPFDASEIVIKDRRDNKLYFSSHQEVFCTGKKGISRALGQPYYTGGLRWMAQP